MMSGGTYRKGFAASIAASLVTVSFAFAEEGDLVRSLGGEEMISLAVGYEQPISKAPAVATVITAEDIAAIGAARIEDVLATVTGLHISKNRAHDTVYVIRSIASEVNPHVLIMINGAPIGDAVQGGRPLGWTLPVQDISRIEIVRGPGSALFGADAFAGTINIVTKNAREIGRFNAGAIGGNFGTYGGWVQSGVVGQRVEAALSFEVQTTEGDDPILSTDFQTFLDLLMGTHASRAPGPIHLARTDVNARAEFKFGDSLTWRAAYQGILGAENGAGVAYALDSVGERNLHLISSDVTYERPIANALDLSLNGSFFREDFNALFQANPPGAFGAFPEGVLNEINFLLTEYRGRAVALYSGLEGHTVRVGAGVNHQRATDIVERRNFFQGPGGILLQAPGFLTTDQLGVTPNAFPASRTNAYALVQDEWTIAKDWILTLGVRADHYSNFGWTVNPRASLVWNASSSLTVKALYGAAFRPPTFLEETKGAGQIALGNQDLMPETIDTVELVIQKEWTNRLYTALNGYAYWTDDLIAVVPSPITGIPTFENANATRGYGVESSLVYKPLAQLQFKGGYAYQSAEFKSGGAAVPGVPRHLAYGEARLEMTSEISSTFGVKYVGKRARQPGDLRDRLGDYVLGDVTLRYAPEALNAVSLSFSIDNLFGVDAREPGPNLIFTPDDIPLEGRRFMARIGVRI